MPAARRIGLSSSFPVRSATDPRVETNRKQSPATLVRANGIGPVELGRILSITVSVRQRHQGHPDRRSA